MRAMWGASLVTVSLLGACGGDEGGESGPRGTAEPPWNTYCMATFTEDFTSIDPFGDVAYSADEGESYLLEELTDDRATFLVLTESGPVDFDIELEAGASFPFTSNCTADAVTSHLGVFRNTPVYSSYDNETLGEKACDLTAGTVEASASYGYSLVSKIELGPDAGPAVYQIDLDVLGMKHCGGLTTGFIEATSVLLGGTHYHPLPVASFIGPK